MGAYMGLAVPMSGAHTMTNSAGTAVKTVCKDGYTTVTLAQDDAYMTTSPGGVEGIRFRLNVTADTTGSSCAAFWVDHDDGTTTGQIYAAEFWITGGAGMAAGQISNINLVNYLDEGYGGMSATNAAFISINDAGGTKMPSLIHIKSLSVGQGCFYAATNTTIDHALRIAIGPTVYYIGLYDALCT